MFRLIFLSTMLVIFMGCSSKKEQDLLKSYTKNIEYHKNLQQTETAELTSGERRVAMITATYMFRATLDKNDTRDEEFIIAVQFEEENSKMNFSKNTTTLAQNTLLSENNSTEPLEKYSLTINNITAIKVERIPHGDKRLKTLSFLTAWSHYYQVTFPHISSKMFNLSFANKTYGSVLLNFSKVAKFVYTQKGF